MGVRNASVALMAVLAGPAVGANEIGPLARVTEDPFFDELPVVLSVSRLAQPLRDAPGSVTVIDAETIRTSGARDLADLLRLVPGFLVAHSEFGAPSAVYHGMTDRNTRGLQVLIDGRSQYSPLFFGGIAWNLIDVSLDEIERIEVIRGSNSAAYGSNAFLGVVNVVTRAAADTRGVRVRVGQGNDGVADRHVRAGMRIGDAAVRVSAESTRDDGVKDFDDRRENRRVNLRADIPLGGADELQVQAGNVEMALRTGFIDAPTNPPREQKAVKEFLSFGWTRNLSDGGSLSARYTRSNEVYDDAFFAREKGLSLFIDYHTSTTRDELELQHTMVPSPETRLVWGAGARHDAVRGQQFYGRGGDAVRQHVNRLFGNFEWRPSEAWTTNLGLTWENDSLSDTSLAPRLAVNYHLSSRQTLRTGLSRAHRIPSLTEARSREIYGAVNAGRPFGVIPLEIERMASGDVDQERIDVAEIGYLGDFREQGLFVDVRAFQEKVSDRILSVPRALVPPQCEVLGLLKRPRVCGSYTDFINGQDLDIRGAEYVLRWRPRQGSEFTLNQTFTHIDSRVNEQVFALNAQTARNAERHMNHSAPTRATVLRWTQELPGGAQMSIAHFRYGRFQWTAGTSVDPFDRTDVRLAYPFRAGPTRGEVALTGQGIEGRRAEFRRRGADRHDPDFAPPQFLDPRYWVSLTLEF
ncbi:TonB-dependent receptor plug domain-containing protein [Aromatoleum toluvorans]|uniref:TonB-dependent receptor plug domain-containing protein n=1 Tax=Aromatoleum toluvorans TaxID=92002 RepID=A0ABX1PXX0_9RHOO|nr:TonB-dependent receptor [Aromatoleum toluvorans]NMG44299.1 TonB-dependent receptor plug domain-containing protein [Aromatoleum toluvorans]